MLSVQQQKGASPFPVLQPPQGTVAVPHLMWGPFFMNATTRFVPWFFFPLLLAWIATAPVLAAGPESTLSGGRDNPAATPSETRGDYLAAAQKALTAWDFKTAGRLLEKAKQLPGDELPLRQLQKTFLKQRKKEAVRLFMLANYEQERGQSAQAMTYLTRARDVFPENRRIQKAWQQLHDRLEAIRKKKIARLLKRADRHIRQHRLIGPRGTNALRDYRQVLTLDPGNPAVKAGLERIVTTYLQLADLALQAKKPRKALQLLHRALIVHPHHPDAIQKQQEAAAQWLPEPPPKKRPQPTMESLPLKASETVSPPKLP